MPSPLLPLKARYHLKSLTSSCLPAAITHRTHQVYLLYGGKTGWLGGKLHKLLQDQGKKVYLAEARLENRESVIK